MADGAPVARFGAILNICGLGRMERLKGGDGGAVDGGDAVDAADRKSVV